MQDLKRFQTFPAFLMLVSNIVRAGSQWVLVWFFAFLGGPGVVGEYTLALAIATPIFIAFEMSLRNVIVTLRRSIAFTTFLLVRAVAAVLALALLICIAGTSGKLFFILLLMGLIKTADSALDLSYGALQKHGDILRIALTSLLNSSVSVATGIIAYWFTRSMELSLVGSLIGSVLTAALVFMPVFRAERLAGPPGGARRADLVSILRAGIPSGLAFAAASLLTYLPIYFLGFAADIRQLGVFAVLAYFPTFATLFYSSVQQSTLHSFVFHYKTGGNQPLTKYAFRLGLPLLLCGILSGVLTLVYGGSFVAAVYGNEFSLTTQELLPIAVSMMLLPAIFVPGAVLLTKNLYGVQFVIGVVSLLLTAIIGVVSGPILSVATAGILFLIGTSTRAVLGVAAGWYALSDKSTTSAKRLKQKDPI